MARADGPSLTGEKPQKSEAEVQSTKEASDSTGGLGEAGCEDRDLKGEGELRGRDNEGDRGWETEAETVDREDLSVP